jgi:EmrB/QacA subfamily drug resistance transporter
VEVKHESPAGRSTIVAITSLGAFLAFLDVSIVNIAFPSLRASFPGASLETLSWVLNAYNVVFAALLVPAGRYADSIGRRRAFALGVAIFTVASFVAAVAPTVGVLIASRVLQAVGAAIIVPASLALMLTVFGIEQRATAVALWGAAAAVAAATGPTLGGALVTAFDWRAVFLVNLPVAALTLSLVPRLPAKRAADRVRLPDMLGIVLLSAGMALLALGVVEGQDWGWGSAKVVGSFSCAAVLLAAFVARSARHPNPAVDLRLLREPSCAIANVGTMLFAMAFYGMLLTNVLFLTGIWGYSAVEAGLALTPAPLLTTVTARPAGRLADRFGQKMLIVPGVMLYVVGAWYFLTRLGTAPDYAGDFLPGACLLGVGVGLAFPSLSSAAVASLDGVWFATGSAINAAARQFGAVIGIAVVVGILSSHARGALDGYQDAWRAITLVCATVVPVALLWPRPRTEPAPTSPKTVEPS